MTLDDIRAANPHLGFAIYAMEPQGAVTLEVIDTEGDIFTFHGNTEKEVLESAFPTPSQSQETQVDVFS